MNDNDVWLDFFVVAAFAILAIIAVRAGMPWTLLGVLFGLIAVYLFNRVRTNRQ